MNYINLYAKFLKKFLKPQRPVRAIFDCSNGTTGIILKELFLKPKIILINDKPDGNFPAHGPNPMIGKAFAELGTAVRKYKADLGVVFDADGDRAFFVDDRGRLVDPDVIAVLISKNFKGPVILDVRGGYLARELIGTGKRKIFDSRVGHTFMKKMMRKRKAAFGGEFSGHYYFNFGGGFYADSGIFAAIQFINQTGKLKAEGLTLSQWIESLPKYHRSGEINFEIKDKERILKKLEDRYKKQAKKISHLDGLKMEFSARGGPAAGGWWFNLRPSNTENLIRLNLEAKDFKTLNSKLQEIKKLLTE